MTRRAAVTRAAIPPAGLGAAKSSELAVQKGMVFTTEPTVVGKLGTCNLEEDALVTADGYDEISRPEKNSARSGLRPGLRKAYLSPRIYFHQCLSAPNAGN